MYPYKYEMNFLHRNNYIELFTVHIDDGQTNKL